MPARRLASLFFLVLALVLVALLWRESKGAAPAGVESGRSEGSEKDSISRVEPRLDVKGGRGTCSTLELVTPGEAEPSPSGDGGAALDLGRFDYGVRGSVTFVGREPAVPLSGTVRAVDEEGRLHQDRIDSDEGFQLYELGPGWWVVEVDLGLNGRAETRVQLTEEHPEAVLEMRATPLPRVDLKILAETYSRSALRWDRRTLRVVAHRGGGDQERPRLAELQPVAVAEVLMGLVRETDSMLGQGSLILPADEALTLTVFAGELPVASRTRAVGEQQVEWTLDGEAWPPALGRLEITVADATTGAVFEAPVRALGWRAVRRTPRGEASAVFEDVPPGWCEVEAGGGDHERLRQAFFVAPGADVKATLELAPAVTLSGRVQGPEGARLGVPLAAWRWDPELEAADPDSYLEVRSSQNGRFEFTSLRPGVYWLRSLGAEEVERRAGVVNEELAVRFVEVDALAEVEGVQLELEPTSTLVLARSEASSQVLRWHLEDGAGRWVRRGELEGLAPTRMTLPVGSYQLFTSEGSSEPRSWPLELGGTTQRVDL